MKASIELRDTHYVVTKEEGADFGIITGASASAGTTIFVSGRTGAESARALAISLNILADEIDKTTNKKEEA